MIASYLIVAAVAAVQDPVPALRGLDPVALCEGEELAGRADLAATHGRHAYRFADEERRARFLADPERYGIQWGGGCARMGPLSGAGSPERFAVHAGRIYVFASDACRSGFLAAPARFVVAATEPEPLGGEARDAGAKWIERAVAAHGGAAALDGARGLRLVLEGEQSGWKHRLEEVLAHDGRLLRRSRWTPPEPDAEPSETTWVLAAEAFVDDGESVLAMTSHDQLADLRRFAQREPIAHLWARGEEGFLAEHLGAGRLGDVPVEDVRVRRAGLATTLHLDPDSGRVLGLSWRGRADDGVTRDVVEAFTEWRDVEGVLVPSARIVSVDGKENASLSATWQVVEVLADVPARVFER
jgi:YHS domain-containing protein